MKFKRVEIQAFKSYLDKRDGIFDFTVKGGEPADLVSIYAPNGFGKTSFYDAIDFCMTNNITRFIRDSSLAIVNNTDAKELNQTGQKQHILRSKNAPDNLESIVKIVTNTDEFERKVSSARAGSKDYAFDDKKTKPEERFFRSVMLSQEAIDSFLRESKPEARYERFMYEQLGGDDSLEKSRQYIQLMLGEINSRLDKLKSQIETVRNRHLLIELGGESMLDSSCLTVINELVSELNEQGCSFSIFDDEFNDESNAKLLLKIAQLKDSINENIEKVLAEKVQLESLLDSFPVYEKHHNEIAALNSDILKLTKQKNDIEQFEVLNDEQGVLKGLLAACGNRLDKLHLHKVQLPDFVSKVKAKNKCNSELADIEHDLNKNTQTLKSKNAELDELESQKAILRHNKVEFETLKTVSPQYFDEITKLEQNIKQLGADELSIKNDGLDKKITDLKSEGILIKSFRIEELDAISESEFDNEILERLAKNHVDGVLEKERLNKRLAELNSSIDSVKRQKDSITRLIDLGSKLVNDNQEQHCPLCQHDHKSFLNLANAVNSNSSLSDSQQRLLKDVETCQTQLKEQELVLKELNESFLIQQRDYLGALREQLKTLFKDKQSTGNSLEQIDKDRAEVNRLKVLTVQKSPELFKLYIDDEISRVASDITVLEGKIDEVKAECNTLIEGTPQLRLDFAVMTSKSKNDDDFITEYSDFLYELKVPLNLIELVLDEQELNEAIGNKLEALTSLFESQSKDVDSNDVALTTLKTPYSSTFFEDLTDKKEMLSELIMRASEQLVRLNGLVRGFYVMVRYLGHEALLEGDNWGILKQSFDDKVSTLQHSIEQSDALNSGMKLLTALAEQLLTYIECLKSTSELNGFDLEIKKYDKIKDALMTDLRVINDSLKKQINHYFHIDLINTIYKKIDPHPDFKKIAFNCVFPDEGRPKLQVYIEDDEGNNIISPTLHFSSAQVNVLSLSIFLAKAINTKNAGKDVDCIFIDDPVQSMDSINVLGVIDLLRSLSVNLGKQIIISTHDDNFHALLKQKLPEHLFRSKFLELESFGKVAAHAGQ
ncbi:hypothetical protein HWV03_18055 [Moritella sp. 36]|uniref:hypothetical protein n=1 Tax=Moritella sp. 36 TaxID=2746233 RepID=UPI001BAC6944|nr:hypothetical protein [Moritella sp. 36]QUM90558.1 hypothetical protein HWV03_18055 [Moritella sp. 36]